MNDIIKNIKLIALDVDGVLTDGKIIIDSEGREIKFFSAHDGMGIKAAMEAGLHVAIVTSRYSKAVEIRAGELGVEDVYLDIKKKIDIIKQLTEKYQILLSEVCYVGDDLVDLEPIVKVGWGVTVPEAPEEIKQKADYVTKRSCGHGAVREVIELILKKNGSWEKLFNKYLGEK